MRALCKFNCGKSGFGDAPGMCGRAQHPTGGEEGLLKAQMCRRRVTLGSGKKGLVGQEDTKAERGGATPRNGQEHFDMLPGDPLTASFDECVSRSANEIGHLERWPVHLLALR